MHHRLKNKVDLSAVEPELLGQSVVRLEEVKLLTANLTTKQVEVILTEIIGNQNKKLRRIVLPWSLVSPEFIAEAFVNLESVDLTQIDLSLDQKMAFFKEIVKTPVMKLKNLKSASCSLSSISSEHQIYSQAIVRVENVDLQIVPALTLTQLKVIFLEIRDSPELKLKTLLLDETSINKIKKNYPDLFYKVSSMVKIIDTR